MKASWKCKGPYLLGAAFSVLALLLLMVTQTYLMGLVEIETNNKPSEELDATILNDTMQVEPDRTRERRLPQAIIIGTRKSGTRALARFLEINPAIRSAHNEVHFFDRLENYKRGLEWYRNQMPLTNNDQLTIEKSPAYFVTSKVPERIKAMNASIKLIVIMRDPVTRLVSDFSQLLANRLKSSPNDYERDDYKLINMYADSTEATTVENKTAILLKAERELEEHVLRLDGGIDEQSRIVRTGMYAMHIERWISVFPRQQFHFVDGERLIKEPQVELQRLELFLGFEKPTILKEDFVFSAKKGFYCLAKRRLTRDKRQTSANRMIDKDEFIKPACLGKSKGRRHVSISKDLKDKLKSFYAPYNEYLFSLTGINFI